MELLRPLSNIDQSSLVYMASHLMSSFSPYASPIAPTTPGSEGSDVKNPQAQAANLAVFAVRAFLIGCAISWIKWGYYYIVDQIEHCKSTPTSYPSQADKLVLFPAAYIPRDDPAYKWVQAWMNNNKDIQHQLVDFTLNCRTASNLSGMDENLIRGEVEYDSDDDEDGVTEQNASWHSGLVLGKVMPRPGEFYTSPSR